MSAPPPPAPPAAAVAKEKDGILLIGDSLTQGYTGQTTPFHSYSIKLSKLIPNYQIYTYGITGQGIQDIYNREVACLVEPEKRRFSFVVLLGGSNDLGFEDTETIKACLNNAFVCAANYLGDPSHLLVMTLPQLECEAIMSDIRDKRLTINNWIRAICVERSYTLVDFDASIIGISEDLRRPDYTQENAIWLKDGLHMSSRGYDALADLVYSVIKDLL